MNSVFSCRRQVNVKRNGFPICSNFCQKKAIWKFLTIGKVSCLLNFLERVRELLLQTASKNRKKVLNKRMVLWDKEFVVMEPSLWKWHFISKPGGDYLRLFVNYLKLFVFSKIIWIICGLFVEKCSIFSSRLFEIIWNSGLFALFQIILDYCKLFVDYLWIIWNMDYLWIIWNMDYECPLRYHRYRNGHHSWG